jgi:hypothetical protein
LLIPKFLLPYLFFPSFPVSSSFFFGDPFPLIFAIAAALASAFASAFTSRFDAYYFYNGASASLSCSSIELWLLLGRGSSKDY